MNGSLSKQLPNAMPKVLDLANFWTELRRIISLFSSPSASLFYSFWRTCHWTRSLEDARLFNPFDVDCARGPKFFLLFAHRTLQELKNNHHIITLSIQILVPISSAQWILFLPSPIFILLCLEILKIRGKKELLIKYFHCRRSFALLFNNQTEQKCFPD